MRNKWPRKSIYSRSIREVSEEVSEMGVGVSNMGTTS